MVIKSFEDIIAWRKARELNIFVYTEFRNSKDFSFREQIQRASVSIMNNIAEGFERQSNKEFKNFLFIAKGSCAEVRSMLLLGFDLNYISTQKFQDNYKLATEISKLLSGLIKTL